jgi:EAL domain-containing protein (putative c-di-GMP-specific phosphodiesterase class I)
MLDLDTFYGALNRGEFFLEYLPLMSVPDGRCVGAEALTRWRHDGRIVMPDQFIPAIEETPLSGLLTYWVIETIAAEVGSWLRAHEDVQMAINVPPEILGRGGLEYAVSKAGLLDLLPKLVMEITERSVPDKLGVDALHRAALRGVRIALDDVDLDGASALVLSRCPIHVIKLDRGLIGQLGQGDGNPEWVERLTGLLQISPLDIVAEGIETEEQLRISVAAGIRLAQGFLFSRPLAAADFLAFFACHR